MLAIAAFLKPTRIRLPFLVEWILFILVLIAQGGVSTLYQLLLAGYPLVLFYLAACILAASSAHVRQLARTWILLLCASLLTIVDQVIKTIVAGVIPYQDAVPIVNNWLYLAHERNYHGSWIASVFDIQPAGVLNLVMWILVVSVLLFSILFYRYYVMTNRKSLWADIVFLGIFAGFLSWFCDMLIRGYIVDYINIPRIVTADFKDILITIGIAAFFAETVDNPHLSWRWEGWRVEVRHLVQFARSFWAFSVQELRRLYSSLGNLDHLN